MKNIDATELAYKNGYEAGKKDVTKVYNSALWCSAAINSIIVICFTAIAITFSKWWIALFAILFFSWPKNAKHYRICDGCGKHSPYTDSHNEALEKAKANGWVHYVDGNKDYCPKCQMKI